MSSNPPPSADPTWRCEKCGWAINDEILADAPDCPHGWVSLEDMPLADIKALFAADGTFNLGGLSGE